MNPFKMVPELQFDLKTMTNNNNYRWKSRGAVALVTTNIFGHFQSILAIFTDVKAGWIYDLLTPPNHHTGLYGGAIDIK